MKMHPYLAALFIALTPAFAADDDRKAGENPAADEDSKATKKEGSLPKDVLGFYGSITGTVETVDTSEVTLKVKITKAEPDAVKNKAPKPETLEGMSIVITPVEKKDDEGKTVLDEKASGYIKGAKSGDPVTLAVRASSKGEVFRLLKVPSAGTK